MRFLALENEVDSILLRARETLRELNTELLRIKALQPPKFYAEEK